MKKIKRKKTQKVSEYLDLSQQQENLKLADTYYNSGYDFHKNGKIEEAINYYLKTLQLNPSHALAIYNLGTAFHVKNQLDTAKEYYQKALQINPLLTGAYYNLGIILQGKKQLDEAVSCYQKAIELDPGRVDPYYNMGLAMQEQGRQKEALVSYDKALQCNPSLVLARWAKCMAQIPVIYPDQSAIGISRSNYGQELINLRDTISLKTSQEIQSAAETIGKQQPFFLAYQGLNDRDLQKIYGDLVCRIMSVRYPHFAERPSIPSWTPGEPLRIGIVSGFFYYHAIWKIPIKGWIENLDRNSFKLYGYYTGTKKDHETDIAKKCFSRFVENTYSFEEFCHIIRRDNLHVLIYPEIGMDPTTVKLAALSLAPIQCASWGHPDTSGLPTIDYYLSSDIIEPIDGSEHYTEQLIRLPNLSFYYTPLEIQKLDLNRETFGLCPKSVLYHCVQSLYKHLPEHDEIFPRIAMQTGDCQFLFASYPNISSVIEQFRLRINKAFRRFNLNAQDYVVFLPPLPPDWYHTLNFLTDIYLDTIGWSGCNSVLEALSCNLPVVTLPTKLMRGREGFAILTTMDVTETIAESLDDYITLAARLGKDLPWRQQISNKIALNKHLVYRDKTCITGLEDFLKKAVLERL